MSAESIAKRHSVGTVLSCTHLRALGPPDEMQSRTFAIQSLASHFVSLSYSKDTLYLRKSYFDKQSKVSVWDQASTWRVSLYGV